MDMPRYRDDRGEGATLPVAWRHLVARLGTKATEEAGSAVVEFVFLGTLLLVPVVYFVIAVGQVQGGSFAVVNAADHAAKVFAASEEPGTARGRAEQAALVAVQDFGYDSGDLTVSILCSSGACLEPGSTVTVDVALDVPLPLMSGFGMSFARVTSTATQIVEQYG
jgi:Flp pilus assembly protein TadG